MALNHLGIRLSELGRREAAVAAAQEAVSISRALVEANPDARLPALAGTLTNLGVILSRLGRRQEALVPAQEAVTICRTLAKANPDAWPRDLTISATNLDGWLLEMAQGSNRSPRRGCLALPRLWRK